MGPGSDAGDDQLRRAQAGDLAAFGEIVERYQRRLRSWLAGFAAAGIDVDEIAQDTFVRAYEHLHRLRPDSDLRAWLFTVARNRLLEELRRRRGSRDRPLSVLDEAERADALARLEGEDEPDERPLEALRRCLAALAPADAQLLQRRYAAPRGAAVPLDAALRSRLHWLRSRLLECVRARLARPEA